MDHMDLNDRDDDQDCRCCCCSGECHVEPDDPFFAGFVEGDYEDASSTS